MRAKAPLGGLGGLNAVGCLLFANRKRHYIAKSGPTIENIINSKSLYRAKSVPTIENDC